MLDALEDNDDDSQSNDGSQMNATDDAADAIANAPAHDIDSIDAHSQNAHQNEEAMSQPADIEVTPTKKKRKVGHASQDPKLTPPKVNVNGDRISKVRKQRSQSIFLQLDAPTDRVLHCFIEKKTCIPMWPQYDGIDDKKTAFVKVGSQEQWVIAYVNLRRKAWRKKSKPTEDQVIRCPKVSISAFCKKILLEFRTVVVAAKNVHKKKYGGTFPDDLTLKFNGVDVFARSDTRQLHFRADAAFMKWIRVGFEATLETHLEDEFKSSVPENKVGCGADKVFNYSGQALDKMSSSVHHY